MKKIKLIISLCIACNFLFYAKAISQNVNQFTGGFSYSVPLITVPSPYGPGVYIGARYEAGIGVNQSASGIGLGWSINLGGVISRNVSGIVDDWNGAVIADPTKAGFKSQGGVMYFNNNTPYDHMDFYKSTYKIDTPEFHFPDYDSYSISGPGLSGSLSPHLFDFGSTQMDVEFLTNAPTTEYVPGNFKRRMQFNFEGDYSGILKSRSYATSPIDSLTLLRLPQRNPVDSSDGISGVTPYVGGGADYSGFDTTTNRLATAKYVEYFTNTQINNNYIVNGFTNIPDSPDRTSTDYEMDGIGAFRVTDASGFVYYYTQPVYTNSIVRGNYPLNNNYEPKIYASYDTTTVTDANGNYYIKDDSLTAANNANPFIIEWKENKRYAYNWLLTAITGPDYVDTDNNKIVNDGDKGYWVVYDWQLWTKNFTKRTPEYGFDYSFNADEKDNTQNMGIESASKISGKYGTFSESDQEIYYLNKIHTASHTAIMVRDVRLDEYSSTTGIPQLKLTRIALYKNEDFSTLNTVASDSAYNVSTAVDSFSLPATGKTLFYNETWYNHVNNKTADSAKSIQTIEFNQDYSLARKYVGNVKTTVSGTNKLSSPSAVASGITVPSNDYASSGKLTLNEILTYDMGHVKTVPSILFDYNKSVATDNPNYNPVKVDYAGFYKSDASAQGYSSYTTAASKDSTDAWSLRKITSPFGGTTEITYESNEYEKVFDGNGGFKGPSKIYMIKSITVPDGFFSGYTWDYTLEEDITTPTDFTDLKDSSYSSGIIKHVFIPYIDDINPFKYINSDTFDFVGASELTSIQKFYFAPNPPSSGSDYINVDGDERADFILSDSLIYTGNGYIRFDMPVGTKVYGGGIRVKSTVTKNGTADAYNREYTYSGGVTPMEFDRFAEEKQLYSHYGDSYYKIKLRPAEYDYHRMGPGIGYTNVTVKDKGQNNTSNGSIVTTFVTSDAGIDNFKIYIQLRTFPDRYNYSTDCVDSSFVSAANDTAYIIEAVDKFSDYWGQVQEIKTRDINDNILSRTVNTYSNSSQGAIVENYDFYTTRSLINPGGEVATCNWSFDEHHHIVCIKREYPVVLSQQTIYTQGISATTEYLTFDSITGAATKVRTTSPNKGVTVETNASAFRIPQYASMGPKSVDSSNANILSPMAYSRTTVDSTITNTRDFGNYNIQTFKKDFKTRMYSAARNKYIDSTRTDQYWVADRSYDWAGDSTSLSNYGLFKQSNFVAFDYGLDSINKKWRLGTENTLLDNSGHILEAKGFNDRFSAVKYGYGDTLQIAQASNTNYSSFTYSGFESDTTSDYIDGEVKMNSGIKTSLDNNHTGDFVVKVPMNTKDSTNSPCYSIKYDSINPNSGLLKGRTYRASVWAHSTGDTCKLSVSFTGISKQSVLKSSSANVTIGNWTLMNVDITIPSSPSDGNELRVYLENPDKNNDAYFDDLRLHPVDAGMSATVYDTRTNRVTATLDGNNFATKYIYDAGGKVTEIWQEIEGIGLKRVKKYQVNYARGLQ